MSEAIKPVDFLDREIRVGDICVYPVRRRSAMWLNRITVHDIKHGPDGSPRIVGLKGDGHTVSVSTLERVAIVGRSNVIPFQE